jgi:hypothetical protein
MLEEGEIAQRVPAANVINVGPRERVDHLKNVVVETPLKRMVKHALISAELHNSLPKSIIRARTNYLFATNHLYRTITNHNRRQRPQPQPRQPQPPHPHPHPQSQSQSQLSQPFKRRPTKSNNSRKRPRF